MKKNYHVMCTTFFKVITQCSGKEGSTILPRGFPKVLKYMFIRWLKLQSCFCSPFMLGSLTLKPIAFEDVHLPPVVSEVSGESILNTNHQILFVRK